MSWFAAAVKVEDRSVEIGLAAARVLLAAGALAAADTEFTGRWTDIGRGVLVAYILVAVGLVVRAWGSHQTRPGLERAVHGLDMLWAVAVALAAPWAAI